MRPSGSMRFPIFIGLVGVCVAIRLGAQTPPAAAPVTFSEHIAPIVFANCTTCHRPGEAAPFQLLSYRDARPLAKAIAAATAARVMPPWKPAATDYPFHDARGVTLDFAHLVQPRFPVEICRLDDERIAFPLAD